MYINLQIYFNGKYVFAAIILYVGWLGTSSNNFPKRKLFLKRKLKFYRFISITFMYINLCMYLNKINAFCAIILYIGWLGTNGWLFSKRKFFLKRKFQFYGFISITFMYINSLIYFNKVNAFSAIILYVKWLGTNGWLFFNSKVHVVKVI
jgi:hypothetical protein